MRMMVRNYSGDFSLYRYGTVSYNMFLIRLITLISSTVSNTNNAVFFISVYSMWIKW